MSLMICFRLRCQTTSTVIRYVVEQVRMPLFPYAGSNALEAKKAHVIWSSATSRWLLDSFVFQ